MILWDSLRWDISLWLKASPQEGLSYKPTAGHASRNWGDKCSSPARGIWGAHHNLPPLQLRPWTTGIYFLGIKSSASGKKILQLLLFFLKKENKEERNLVGNQSPQPPPLYLVLGWQLHTPDLPLLPILDSPYLGTSAV